MNGSVFLTRIHFFHQPHTAPTLAVRPHGLDIYQQAPFHPLPIHTQADVAKTHVVQAFEGERGTLGGGAGDEEKGAGFKR